MSSTIRELLQETAKKIKHCQELTVSSPDGLTIESYPGEDKSLTDALSASSSSILGIASAISERAGKQESEYVLIKNPDSYLLVFSTGAFSLFVIADIKANLGMLLYRAGLLKTKLEDLLNIDVGKDEEETEKEQSESTYNTLEPEAARYDDIIKTNSDEEAEIEQTTPQEAEDIDDTPQISEISQAYEPQEGLYESDSETEGEETEDVIQEIKIESNNHEIPTISFKTDEIEADEETDDTNTDSSSEVEKLSEFDDSFEDEFEEDETAGYEVDDTIKRGYDDIIKLESEVPDAAATKQIIESDEDEPTEMVSYLKWREQQDEKKDEPDSNDEEKDDNEDLFEGF